MNELSQNDTGIKPSQSVEQFGGSKTPSIDETLQAILKLKEEVEKGAHDLKAAKKDAETTKNLMLVGFFVLLFMLGQLMVEVFYERSSTENRFIEKIDSLTTQPVSR
jgi:hypothetical protein